MQFGHEQLDVYLLAVDNDNGQDEKSQTDALDAHFSRQSSLPTSDT